MISNNYDTPTKNSTKNNSWSQTWETKFSLPVHKTEAVIRLERNVTTAFARDEASLVKVILMTYSRSGSSFLGELFNQHPHGFYTFEPLKGLYSALYGLGDVNEASSAVFHFVNDTERYPDEFEEELIADQIVKLLNCDFERYIHVALYNFCQF